MGVELVRKYVKISITSGYRSVLRHPFLVVMVFVLILLYRLFPLLFSLLVYASPVIVSTAVLLGTLLSLGQPNIPEIEKEEKPDHDEIHNLKTTVMKPTEIVERDGSDDTSACRTEVGDRSFNEKTSVVNGNDDKEVDKPDDSVSVIGDKSQKVKSEDEQEINEVGNGRSDVDEEKVVLENHYAQILPSEDENTELESDGKLNSASGLLWKRVEDDEEGSESGSDVAESSSPDASMADIVPMLDELHPLLGEEQEAPRPAHMAHDASGVASEHSLESSDSSNDSDSDDDDDDDDGDDDDDDIATGEDLEVGDDEGNEDKEDEPDSAITWTEDDQKNLMNLGTSELERNQRLENLIARRRARKNMRMQAEKNLIDLESSDLPFNVSPISTTRKNPFDLPYDSNDSIPGSAPSVLLPRRNPFDLPYDSSEEKPNLAGDTFQQDFVGFQPKDPFFRRHESFNVGPSVFGASRHERQEIKLRPYFVPEWIASDSSFEKQLHETNDSKVRSVPDTESFGSAGDPENRNTVTEDLSREVELVVKEHEHEHVETSTGVHVAEHLSQSSEDDGIVQLSQVEREDERPNEAKTIVWEDQELETDFSEIDNVSPSMELMSNAVNLDAGEEERHSSGSSSSSSSEVIEHIYNEKEGEETSEAVPETDSYFVEAGTLIEKSDSNVSNLLAEDSQHKEPIYDSSPPAFRKNLSSSSISTEERISSFSGRESDEIVQNIKKETPGNDAELVDNEVRESNAQTFDQDTDGPNALTYQHNLKDSEQNLGPSRGEDHLQISEELHSSSSIPDAKEDLTYSSKEEHREPLLAVEKIATSLPDKTFPEAGDSLTDMKASHQLEQFQIPSSPEAIPEEGDDKLGSSHHIHASEEKSISQSEELSLSNKSMDKPLAEDSEELQGHELEQGQGPSPNFEAQILKVFHEESNERPGPNHQQLVAEGKVTSQADRGLSSSDKSLDEPSTENPEVMQIQKPENKVSSNFDSAPTNEVQVTVIETKVPQNLAYESGIYIKESHDVPENIEDVDDIKAIDENILAELDAIGDFNSEDLRSNNSTEVCETKSEIDTVKSIQKVLDTSEASEVSRTSSFQDDNEVVLPQNTESSDQGSTITSPTKSNRFKTNEASEVSRTSSFQDDSEVVLPQNSESSDPGSTISSPTKSNQFETNEKSTRSGSSSSSSSSSSSHDSDKE